MPHLFKADSLFDRYDLLHNAHLNLEGLDELFNVAKVCGNGLGFSFYLAIFLILRSMCHLLYSAFCVVTNMTSKCPNEVCISIFTQKLSNLCIVCTISIRLVC